MSLCKCFKLEHSVHIWSLLIFGISVRCVATVSLICWPKSTPLYSDIDAICFVLPLRANALSAVRNDKKARLLPTVTRDWALKGRMCHCNRSLGSSIHSALYWNAQAVKQQQRQAKDDVGRKRKKKNGKKLHQNASHLTNVLVYCIWGHNAWPVVH